MEIRLEHLTKKYDGATAVSNLSLTIEDGALHFILGPSGCGKTTTLRMIAGLETASSGKIYFDGKDVTQLSPADRGIGMVFQNYALWPHMTIEENISYGLKLKKLSAQDIKKRCAKYMKMMHLEELASRYPSQLSGGQQQRVALARALAIEPKVLLLDEPLSNLDAKLRSEMRQNLKKIHKEVKVTTIYVTHDQSESLSMGTSISIMKSGEHIQSGSPKEVYNKPQNAFIAKFIGETNLIKGTYQTSKGLNPVIQTDFGQFMTQKNSDDFKDNEPVLLSMRPEFFKITKNKNDSLGVENNIFSAEVGEKTYLGESELWKITKNKQNITAKIHSGEEKDFPEGSSISCSIPSSHITLFKDQSA